MFQGLSEGMLWGTIFTFLGAFLGIICLLLSVWVIPRMLNRFTPHIDEEAEILRGNRAVADYFGRLVAATILGVSIIIAASIIAGIHG
ncbi:MAG: DUF350 domain-containing protein [Candidatus Riflebacteria bacterium]|nr:DUF350 domain-containing protein [Candidatus Riflebacteria bacterium]